MLPCSLHERRGSPICHGQHASHCGNGLRICISLSIFCEPGKDDDVPNCSAGLSGHGFLYPILGCLFYCFDIWLEHSSRQGTEKRKKTSSFTLLSFGNAFDLFALGTSAFATYQCQAGTGNRRSRDLCRVQQIILVELLQYISYSRIDRIRSKRHLFVYTYCNGTFRSDNGYALICRSKPE